MKIFRYILIPFAILYGFITFLRNKFFDLGILKSYSFQTPTIVVGNLSVGGTGKTPQIEYLIRLLKDIKNVAVLSRGYKRKSEGYIIASENDSAVTLGDEPYQYFRKFYDISVCVDSNRVRAIQNLERLQNTPEVILLDDAFQHRKVNGGFNILLTSYDKLFYKDCMLPTGDLREPQSGANRADAIIVTKCPDTMQMSEQKIIEQKLVSKYKKPVFFTKIAYSNEIKGASLISVDELKDYELLLVTGIAKPKPLLDYLKSKAVIFKHIEFPDHHDFTEKDILNIKKQYNSLISKQKLILTTEKDYVRIFGELKNLHYIEIETAFVTKEEKFKKLIINYVG